ncbi:hypothetical protein Cch01nite_19720 [Cellulomonas chitinilytica]|uniref:Uncharacterized protein n=1 Tax=Cellulomonas chitinilytica TaxID=398759 RepID=A0A919TZV4_9CELL|nr:hypothetical protein [Cellulomonas chitinilytica]GIG21248.1 hypothetical protein Cch01nite_19720 [Cellulomonas chitinilytica]
MTVPAPLSPSRLEPAARAGLVLHVSLPDEAAHPSSAQLAEVAELLREIAEDLLPGAQTATALSFVPGGSGDVRQVGERLTHLRLLDPPCD